MIQKSELAQQFAQQTIYLMGVSFILGSLCTIFALIMLEIMRLNREKNEPIAQEETIVDELREEEA